jgi:hypothetical protein
MRKRLALLFVVVVSAVGAGSVAPVPSPIVGTAEAKTCSSGWTHAVLPGGHKCLRSGQFCTRSWDRYYHRYGYHCHRYDARVQRYRLTRN